MKPVWSAFVGRCLINKAVLVRFRDQVQSVMFKDTYLANIYRMVLEFYDRYGKTPTQDEMSVWMRTLPPSEKEPQRLAIYANKLQGLYDAPPDMTEDVLLHEVVAAIREHMVEEMVLDGSGMVDAGRVDYDVLMEQMKRILRVSVDSNLGTSVGHNPEATVSMVAHEARHEAISIGPQGVDRVLRGGLFKKQLACGIGASGVGKSTVLVNQAVNACLSGADTVLVTCELDEEKVVDRIVRRITKMKRREIMNDQGTATERLGRFFQLTDSKLIVKYVEPASYTVEDVANYLDMLHAVEGVESDVVIIDYLDELRAERADARLEVRHRHHSIARSLVGLSKARNVAVSTMTQTNRDAVDKEKITEKDIGEDYGKIKVSDLVYALCQTEEERKAMQARFRFLKVRDGPGKGIEVPVRLDLDIMLIEGLEVKTYQDEEITW